jgi:hypothetical protein
MNKYILSWDNSDGDASKNREELIDFILEFDDKATIEQPLLSSFLITSQKDYELWLEEVNMKSIHAIVFYSFSQIMPFDDSFCYKEHPNDKYNDSLTEILEKRKEKLKKENETLKTFRRLIQHGK